MSGGSLDYVYSRVSEAADMVRHRSRRPLHQAFADHLDKVSKALKDLEWMFSCDTMEGSEDEAILAVVSRSQIIETSLAAAEKAKKDLDWAIDVAKKD